MPYSFTATTDYFVKQRKVTTLISFAEQEGLRNKEDNRSLFLKLGVVLLITRFQVYIESVLEEYVYRVKNSNRQNSLLPIHLRLTAIKLLAENYSIHRELENPLTYDTSKLQQIQVLANDLNNFCIDANLIQGGFTISTQFPLGRQGLSELKALFRQIEVRDIFENARFDINKLNEILHRRHNIIHEDANMQLTELKLREYRDFLSTVVRHIDKYMTRHLI